MNPGHLDELRQQVNCEELDPEPIRRSGLFENLVEDLCPICSGLGVAIKRDESGNPLTIRCLSCSFGSSADRAGSTALAWRCGSDLFLRRSEQTFELANAICLNRIATALEALAAKFAPVDDEEPSE